MNALREIERRREERELAARITDPLLSAPEPDPAPVPRPPTVASKVGGRPGTTVAGDAERARRAGLKAAGCRKQPIRPLVMRVMGERGEPVTLSELCAAIDGPTRKQVRQSVYRAMQAGMVSEVRPGLFQLAGPAVTPPALDGVQWLVVDDGQAVERCADPMTARRLACDRACETGRPVWLARLVEEISVRRLTQD